MPAAGDPTLGDGAAGPGTTINTELADLRELAATSGSSVIAPDSANGGLADPGGLGQVPAGQPARMRVRRSSAASWWRRARGAPGGRLVTVFRPAAEPGRRRGAPSTAGQGCG